MATKVDRRTRPPLSEFAVAASAAPGFTHSQTVELYRLNHGNDHKHIRKTIQLNVVQINDYERSFLSQNYPNLRTDSQKPPPPPLQTPSSGAPTLKCDVPAPGAPDGPQAPVGAPINLSIKLTGSMALLYIHIPEKGGDESHSTQQT